MAFKIGKPLQRSFSSVIGRANRKDHRKYNRYTYQHVGELGRQTKMKTQVSRNYREYRHDQRFIIDDQKKAFQNALYIAIGYQSRLG